MYRYRLIHLIPVRVPVPGYNTRYGEIKVSKSLTRRGRARDPERASSPETHDAPGANAADVVGLRLSHGAERVVDPARALFREPSEDARVGGKGGVHTPPKVPAKVTDANGGGGGRGEGSNRR